MTCETTGTLTICRPGRTEIISTRREDPRWCFGERKRQAGTWEAHAEIEPGYYGPFWVYKCDGCHQDRRLFPGWVESWE